MSVIEHDPATEAELIRLARIAQAGLDQAVRASFAAGRERGRADCRGAVAALDAALRLARLHDDEWTDADRAELGALIHYAAGGQ